MHGVVRVIAIKLTYNGISVSLIKVSIYTHIDKINQFYKVRNLI